MLPSVVAMKLEEGIASTPLRCLDQADAQEQQGYQITLSVLLQKVERLHRKPSNQPHKQVFDLIEA